VTIGTDAGTLAIGWTTVEEVIPTTLPPLFLRKVCHRDSYVKIEGPRHTKRHYAGSVVQAREWAHDDPKCTPTVKNLHRDNALSVKKLHAD
jgi:hypothetical protein